MSYTVPRSRPNQGPTQQPSSNKENTTLGKEGFFEKIGTLGRRNKKQDAQPSNSDQQQYQSNAPSVQPIDAPGLPPEIIQDDTFANLEEKQERLIIHPESLHDNNFRTLVKCLVEWINDELSEFRIIIKEPIEEDLFDGQVLQKLVEKLEQIRIEVPEVSQSEEGQRKKLRVVLEEINNSILQLPDYQRAKWSVDGIHSKNQIEILHLLVCLARHYRPPLRLPENVAVRATIVQKRDGMLQTSETTEQITSTYDEWGQNMKDRDAFDTLFEHAPEKLNLVKKKLLQFANHQLNVLNLQLNDIETQFHDGVYLILIMGLLEGYFVPMSAYNSTPTSYEQKVANTQLAFDLMQDAGLPKPKSRPEDIVNLDLKSTLRVLYTIFTKWKSASGSL